jgi:hypothetical protein
VNYCSVDCQRKDWKRHKNAECKLDNLDDEEEAEVDIPVYLNPALVGLGTSRIEVVGDDNNQLRGFDAHGAPTFRHEIIDGHLQGFDANGALEFRIKLDDDDQVQRFFDRRTFALKRPGVTLADDQLDRLLCHNEDNRLPLLLMNKQCDSAIIDVYDAPGLGGTAIYSFERLDDIGGLGYAVLTMSVPIGRGRGPIIVSTDLNSADPGQRYLRCNGKNYRLVCAACTVAEADVTVGIRQV